MDCFVTFEEQLVLPLGTTLKKSKYIYSKQIFVSVSGLKSILSFKLATPRCWFQSGKTDLTLFITSLKQAAYKGIVLSAPPTPLDIFFSVSQLKRQFSTINYSFVG